LVDGHFCGCQLEAGSFGILKRYKLQARTSEGGSSLLMGFSRKPFSKPPNRFIVKHKLGWFKFIIHHSKFKKMNKTYYNPDDLKKFGNIAEFSPKLAEKFFSYYGEVFAEGELTAREKSLIALAVAHTVQCPYCIDAYSVDSLEKGATEGQMMEAIHVAAAIRGGSSLVHGVQMMNKVKEIVM
jgi:alkylhydroperoxidase/carboxymuconolactone decarboxylase family protein